MTRPDEVIVLVSSPTYQLIATVQGDGDVTFTMQSIGRGDHHLLGLSREHMQMTMAAVERAHEVFVMGADEDEDQ